MTLAEERSILLTGATGYLGSHLTCAFIEKKYNVYVLKRPSSNLSRITAYAGRTSVFDSADLEELFERHRPRIVVHTAANYGRKGESPAAIVEDNVLFGLRILELAKKFEAAAFINAGTGLSRDVSYYALSKAHMVEWMKFYSSSFACVNVKLEHFYGPSDDSSKFVTRMIRQILAGVPAIELTPGEQLRDFIHIEDVVGGFLCILEHLPGNGFYEYELGSGQAVSIRRLMEMIKIEAKNTGTELKFGAVPYRENEQMLSVADISGMNKIGWKPSFDLQEGLRRTIEMEKK